jgi:hypothetical protein
MPINQVKLLMDAVEKLHTAVITLQTDVDWLKKGQIGMFAAVGAGMVTVVVTLLMK